MKADPQHILLVGAGFSRNWGGWLAAEALEYLLAHQQIDKSIRDLLWTHRNTGFEDALSELQRNGRSDPRLAKMENALADMYSHMEDAFERIDFDVHSPMKISYKEFLRKFDAIFSLNQDLLLERFYVSERVVGAFAPCRYSITGLPGIQMIENTENTFHGIGTFTPTGKPFQVEEDCQPYYKLHGSANWKTERGGQLLILGGQKSSEISKVPLLKYYSEEFHRRLSVGSVRLMVIGYSFGDSHINKAICECVKEFDLKLFIVDPLGLDVLDKNLRWINSGNVYVASELMSQLWHGLVGASRRPLTAIFDRDRVEFEKLMRFFQY